MLFSQSGEIATQTGVAYTVQEYLTRMQNNSLNPEMVALAKAAEDYGIAAQLYFEYNTEGLTIPKTVTDVALSDLAPYAPSESGKLPAGISSTANSVLFQSDNTLRTYFMYEEGTDVSKLSFQVDGEAAQATDQSSSKRCYLSVPAVAAKNLDDEHVFTVSDGTNTYSYTISAIGYAHKMIETSTNEAMVNLAKALYLYNQAAIAYLGK